jgi:Transposase DDE domain
VVGLRALKVTPHVAQNTANRRPAIDGRTTRRPGYALSQRARRRIEEAFGWIKEVALLRRARHRGKDDRIGWRFTLAAAAYDLIRLPKLLGRPT